MDNKTFKYMEELYDKLPSFIIENNILYRKQRIIENEIWILGYFAGNNRFCLRKNFPFYAISDIIKDIRNCKSLFINQLQIEDIEEYFEKYLKELNDIAEIIKVPNTIIDKNI